MSSVSYRTELLTDEEIAIQYVPSDLDERIVEALLSNSPILLEGSRGTGKTMLMRIAQQRIRVDFLKNRNIAVLVSFQKTMFVSNEYLVNWILSKIAFELREEMKNQLQLFSQNQVDMFNKLFGYGADSGNPVIQKLDKYIDILERSWRSNNETAKELDTTAGIKFDSVGVLNEVNYFLALVNYIRTEFNINKVFLYFDEACHNFFPEQQRRFFNLFRDLTTPYINCKAAVYPGISSYGDTLQRFHDVSIVKLNREVTNVNYLEFMGDIIHKKTPELYKKLRKQSELLNTVLFSASGNPRVLIKSLSSATEEYTKGLNISGINNMIKDFYRSDIWTDHHELLNKYAGHKAVIEWGKDIVETELTMRLDKRNNGKTGKTSFFFSVDMQNTKSIRRAFDILEYSGISNKIKEGYKKAQAGQNRHWVVYQLNVGILIAESASPHSECKRIFENLGSIEDGIFLSTFPELKLDCDCDHDPDRTEIITRILNTEIEKLDLSSFLKSKISEVGLNTIGEILEAGKKKLKEAYLVGEKRSSAIFDVAQNAVLEYISG